jgi:competence protein ComEA
LFFLATKGSHEFVSPTKSFERKMHPMRQTKAGSLLRTTAAPALVALAFMSSAGPTTAAADTPASAPAAKASAPVAKASAPAPAAQASAATKKKAPATPVKLVDINSAGRKELKTLPGIGDAEAERIIANRPYLSKAELVAKNVLPMGPYQSIRHRIVALQKPPPKGKN